jgi:hypothetical protein
VVPFKARCNLPLIKQISPSDIRGSELAFDKLDQEIGGLHKQEKVTNSIRFERNYVMLEQIADQKVVF